MFDPKKLGEEADQLIQSLNQPAEDAVAAEDQAEKTETEAIAQDEVVDTPSTTDDHGTDPTAETEEAAVDTGEATEATSTNEAVDALTKRLDAADQKWRVLQGMINKKDQELAAAKEVIAQLSTAPEPAASEATAPTPSKLLTDSDVKEFGSELVDMVTRAARDVSSELSQTILSQVDERFKSLEGSVETVERSTAKTTQDLFYEGLHKSAPNWEALNTDATFLAWLDETEAFTGLPRLHLLQDAVQKGDVGRAANFFKSYEQMTAPAPDTTTLEDEADPAPAPAQDKLAKQIAPGRSRTASAPADTGKRQWDRSAIAKLYDDKRNGKIAAKEFDRLERDLFAAQADGRIAV